MTSECREIRRQNINSFFNRRSPWRRRRSFLNSLIASIWRENVLGYLSADIICSEKRTVFRERSLRKTVSLKEQITSKDKYPSILSPQMEAIVYIVLRIFFAARAVLKIGEYLVNKPLQAAGMSADNVHG